MRRANEIPRKASAYSAQVNLDRPPRLWPPSSMLTERDRGQPICGELPLTRSSDLPARTPVSYPPYRQRTGASPLATPAVLGCTVGGEGLLGRIAGFRSNPPAAPAAKGSFASWIGGGTHPTSAKRLLGGGPHRPGKGRAAVERPRRGVARAPRGAAPRESER